MERSTREGRHHKPRSRGNQEGEEDSRDSRRRPERKKRENGYPHSRAKGSSVGGDGGVGRGQVSSGYHRQRDVPPRFQQTHSRTSKQHKYSATRTSATGAKKQPSKDPTTNRWHQNQPSSLQQQQSCPPPVQTTTTHLLSSTRQHRSLDDDGGWSRGSPAKGSGWSSKHKPHGLPGKTLGGNQVIDWRGSPEVDAAAIWPVADHRQQGSVGSGEVDGWSTFSPGQSSRQHSQTENWMSDEGSLSVGDNTCSPHSNSSPSPSNVGGWHVGPDTAPNLQHELEPIEDEMNEEETCDVTVDHSKPVSGPLGDHEDTPKSDLGWDALKPMPHQTSHSELPRDASGPLSSPSPSSQFCPGVVGATKNMSSSPSRDLEKTLETPGSDPSGAAATASDREVPTHIDEFVPGGIPNSLDLQPSGTPDGAGSSVGVGGGLGMSMWRSQASVGGSTSSINSIGSSSSWKSEGKNGYHSKPSSYSPRKTTRYDSQSSSISTSSAAKLHLRKTKKPTTDLDDALESLHSEPSGWGDLPSPKPTDVDNGTEIWGVAPDDMHRKIKHSNGWGDSGESKMGGVMMGRGGGGEWGDDSVGWPGAAESRGRRVGTPVTPSPQWLPPSKDSWVKKQSRQGNFTENITKLMDMGFSHQVAEKYLKANGNDLNATISDLLALGLVPDDGSLMSSSGGGRAIKKQPTAKGLAGGNNYFSGGAGSFLGLSTPPGGGAPGISGVKDLYHQQLMQNSFAQTHASLAAVVAAGGGGALQAQQLQYMQLPSATVPGFLQLLNNQLSQLKAGKLQVMQQLQAVRAQGGSGSAQQQVQTLQQRLLLINQMMTHINQQLAMQKYPSQLLAKDKVVGGAGGGMLDGMVKSVTPGAVGSQPIGRHTPPSRSKDVKSLGPLQSRSMSLPGPAHEQSLSLGMQGLSMNGHVTPSSISQSSARSVSRLQQIISGSSSDDSPMLHTSDDKVKFRFPPQSAATTPAADMFSTSSPLAGSGTPTTTPASTPFSPARSFTDIQEFRPGVPWQPRTLPTEPAQLYAKPTGGPVSRPELRTVQSEPVFPHYGTQSLQRRPPSLAYSGPSVNPGGYRTRNTSTDHQPSTWQTVGAGSTSSPMTSSPFGVPQTPDSAFSSGVFGKKQQGLPLPHSNSGLAFNAAVNSGVVGQQPLSRPSALFPGPHSFSQAPGRPPSSSSSSSAISSTGSDMPGSRWRQPRGKFTSSSESSSSGSGPHPASLTSSSMWDSSVGHSSGTHPSSTSWSSLGLDSGSCNNNNNGFAPTPSSGTEPAVSGFCSPPPPRTSCSSSDGLTPGLSGAWDKGGLESPNHKHTVLSPEPTFAEWKDGKKAHLSVFKLPSNPPSCWLCLHNINSQVDEASLRDVCSEFGHLETVAISTNTEMAIVQYSTKEQAMQAKSGLDKSPVVCGVSITVDFISEQRASNFVLKQQQAVVEDGTTQSVVSESQWLSQPEALPTPSAALGGSGSTLANGSHWEGMGLVGQFSQSCETPTTANCNSQNSGSKTDPTVLWSNSGFLPGLTSPWSNHPQTESALFPSSSSSSSSKQETAAMSSSPSLSTYLPNGLF